MTFFLQKQPVITTTMTKHIYSVFNLSFILQENKKTDVLIYLLFSPKDFEILVLCMFSEQFIVLHRFHTYVVLR